jgi:hypothetical protein
MKGAWPLRLTPWVRRDRLREPRRLAVLDPSPEVLGDVDAEARGVPEAALLDLERPGTLDREGAVVQLAQQVQLVLATGEGRAQHDGDDLALDAGELGDVQTVHREEDRGARIDAANVQLDGIRAGPELSRVGQQLQGPRIRTSQQADPQARQEGGS